MFAFLADVIRKRLIDLKFLDQIENSARKEGIKVRVKHIYFFYGIFWLLDFQQSKPIKI